jgi:hypothetical protein
MRCGLAVKRLRRARMAFGRLQWHWLYANQSGRVGRVGLLWIQRLRVEISRHEVFCEATFRVTATGRGRKVTM